MKHVALLRGINVGGNNKVDMKQLKSMFERIGFKEVRTYINSGNVVFDTTLSHPKLTPMIEQAIEQEFGFAVATIVRSQRELAAIVQAIPDTWTNDQAMKCDVLFLWQQVDSPDILGKIAHKPDIEDVLYLPHALVWRIDRENATRGSMVKIVGTDIYRFITVRNINTVRKLLSMMDASAKG